MPNLEYIICRKCEHYHCIVNDDLYDDKICINSLFGDKDCRCKELIPKDNLKYLEYVYDKKGEDKK